MKIFISHAMADNELVSEFAAQLRNEGFEVFSPDRDVLPGENLARRVADAIERADAMVVIGSEDAGKSHSVLWEVNFALGSPKYKNRLITVLMDKDAEIPWILNRLPVIHLNKKTRGEVGRLVAERLREVATA